jgi:hypothetical protein
MAGMNLQALESHPGLGTNAFVELSPRRKEERRSGRNFGEFEDTWDPEAPDLPSLLPVAPCCPQVGLCSWGRAPGSLNLLTLSNITCMAAESRSSILFIPFFSGGYFTLLRHLCVFNSLCAQEPH